MKKFWSVILIFVFAQSIFLTGFKASYSGRGEKHYLDPKTPQKLREMFRYTGDSVSFLSSHRGGPEKNLPENSIPCFANTLKHTYSIIELDTRYTKDSIMVVHHDPTLERTTTGKGKVSDFTLKEIKELKLKDMEGNVTRYKVPAFDAVLKWAKGKTILVLDKKDVPIRALIKMVERYKAESYTIVMAYTFEDAKLCYKINRNIMMQVFINSPEKVRDFDQTGVPWENVVVFVSHQKPDYPEVFQMIHQKGALCILGTSRNLDREFLNGKVGGIEELNDGYNALYRSGADILETDIPVPVSQVVARRLSSETFKSKFLK